MKEIGEKLQKTREDSGLTIEEVGEDLKLEVKKIQAIEEGKKEVFKDIYELKNYIRDYSKYLCMDYDKLIEDFNEFIFDYTSKIPVDVIKKQVNNENKVVSPYTVEVKKSNKKIFFIILIVLLVSIVALFFVFKKDIIKDENIAYMM